MKSLTPYLQRILKTRETEKMKVQALRDGDGPLNGRGRVKESCLEEKLFCAFPDVVGMDIRYSTITSHSHIYVYWCISRYFIYLVRTIFSSLASNL